MSDAIQDLMPAAPERLQPSYLDPTLWSKRALVTGASRGIGEAIATALARAGVTVTGTATTQTGAAAISQSLQQTIAREKQRLAPLLASTESEFSQLGVAFDQALNQSQGLVLDVSQTESTEALLLRVGEEGGVDILVNNAGITRDNLALRMRADEWHTVIDTNLSACFRLSQALMRPMMKKRWGRIINISSVVGETGNPGQANYAAAKAGLAGMSRALARELGSRQITVNCIAPGFIETDMTRALSEGQIAQMQQQIPLQRFGLADDVAAAVLFLAGQSGSYVTGESLQLNGGMFMN